MIAKQVDVIKSKKGTFTNDKGQQIGFYQICCEDSERLYLLSSKNDIPAGTTIDIAYDASLKRFSIIEYMEERS